MKTTLTIAAIAMSALTATAVPINITVDGSGNLLNTVGIANNTQYGQGDNNPGSNLTFLTGLIGNWNGVPLSPVLPAAGALALDQGSLGGTSSYSGPSGYEYVVFHYGAGQAGGQQVSPGGWWSAYYLGGSAISIGSLPQVDGKNVGGFSSARYFGVHDDGSNPGGNPVPDGGATAALLGLGALGLAAARRSSK